MLKRAPSLRQQANEVLDEKIINVFDTHKSHYGSPRIIEELHEIGQKFRKNRVIRRIKYLGLRAKAKKKFKVTTDSKHDLPTTHNVLNRDFTADSINKKWPGDITYSWTNEGWLYLAVVIDLYSSAVIGWSIQAAMTRELISDALIMALTRRNFPRGMIFHSDRGSHYCRMIIKNY